ncbi:MAG: hypothetical protein LBR47_03440, partial [Spirochaetaceae bacterium]|nr:hypothetical protein [Spirochaetaceae bacterium]
MRDFRDILTWDDKALSLDTMMTERDFSRAGFARLLDNPGLLAVPPGGIVPPEPVRFIVSCNGFSLYEWRFTHTELKEPEQLPETKKTSGGGRLTDMRLLRLSVPIPSGAGSRGKLLYDCVTGGDWDARLRWDALLTVISAMDAAVSAGMAGMTAPCGPLGIMVREDGSVLFLPVPLFPRLVASWGDDFSYTYLDIWTNLSRGMESGAVYTASVCLYRMLTGFFPRDEKSNGYGDIVPLEIAAYNIDSAVA